MLNVGVDLIENERIARTLGRFGSRFADRVFTPQEQAHCGGRIPSLAGRFALKEAVAKALGTGIGEMRWLDIEIVSDARGKPALRLHGRATTLAAEQGITHWAISLSHTTTHAIGFAVGQGSVPIHSV